MISKKVMVSSCAIKYATPTTPTSPLRYVKIVVTELQVPFGSTAFTGSSPAYTYRLAELRRLTKIKYSKGKRCDKLMAC
jgi:hypothetical protein